MGVVYKFPDENISNAEKDSIDFGKKYGDAILSKHETTMYKRKHDFDLLRKYAKAQQPISKYKEIVCNEYVSVKYLNVNWEKRVNILPRYLRKAQNGINISEFEEKIFALNPEARKEQSRKKKEKVKLLDNKDLFEQIEQMTGQSPVPKEMIPNSMEEIELDSVTNESLDIEVAEELLITGIKQENRFEYIFNRVKKDVFELGVGVVECYTDANNGIQVKYLNPDFWGHSDTQDPFFSDCNYFYDVKKVPLREFRRICQQSKIDISEKELSEILQSNGFSNYTPSSNDYKLDEGQLIEVVFFTFKTFKKELYKKVENTKTGKVKLIDRTKHIGKDNAYNPNPSSEYKTTRIDNSYDVWYEGIMTTKGKRKVISYALSENMATYKGNILPRYIAVAPRIDADGYNSLVEESTPIIDEIQILDYKRQHLISELKGNITDIDSDGIAEISLGKRKLSAKEVLELYFSKSIRLRKTIDTEGNPINSAPSVQETVTGIPYAFREVVGEIVRQADQINSVFGFRGSDESKPNEETLFEGEPYRLSDNLTLKDLVDGLLFFNSNVSQTISSRLDDVFKFMDVKEKYISWIGDDDIKTLEKFRKERALSYFGATIGFIPSRQERIQTITDINTALSSGQISLIDAIELRSEKNMRIAVRRLKLRMEQYAKKMQESEMGKINGQVDANSKAAQISQEEKRKTLKLEFDNKAELEKLKANLNFIQAEADGRMRLMVEKMNSDGKMLSQQEQRNFDAEIAQYKKEMERQTRIEVNKESIKNQEKLFKVKQGELSSVDEQALPEVDLSQLNN